MAYLPDEIKFEVLIRLPVKFKCVCKSWRSLISESKFIKTHLKIDVNVGGHRLLLPTTTPQQLIQSINYEAAAENNGDNNTIASVSLDFVTDCSSSKYGPSVSGSCNGLVCVIGPTLQITLWNPCTRDARTLPKPASRGYTSCGLGYDSSSDDYKVVLANNSFILVDDRINVEVFSLRRNTWKMVEDINPRCGGIFSNRPAFLNGALHCVADCGTGELIFSFDLVTEKLQELVPFPPAQGTFFSVGCLLVLDGCVSVVSRRCRDDISFAHEIWVMKEYGVEASWTKLFTICIPHSCYLEPVCFSKNGELLVNVGGRELKMYNPKAMTLRDIDIPGKCRWSAMVPYVESLVSPNDFHGENN